MVILELLQLLGDGNVAMDSSRASIRMGAKKVYVLYRRDQESMPARELELKEAIEDGIEIMYETKVISGKTECGKITEINCIKTDVINGRVIDIENSKFTMKIDTVIFAIGLLPDKQILKEAEIELDRDLVNVNEYRMTNVPGIFAGGDLIEARSYVCKAIQSGKITADNIEGSLLS